MPHTRRGLRHLAEAFFDTDSVGAGAVTYPAGNQPAVFQRARLTTLIRHVNNCKRLDGIEVGG